MKSSEEEMGMPPSSCPPAPAHVCVHDSCRVPREGLGHLLRLPPPLNVCSYNPAETMRKFFVAFCKPRHPRL